MGGDYQLRIFFLKRQNSKICISDRILDAKNGKGGLKATGRTGAKDADVTFEATDSDLYDILTGKLDAKQAYFSVS